MPCCASREDAGRATFGVFVAVFFAASLAYFVVEFATLETLDVQTDTPRNTNVTLLWADLAGCTFGVFAALVVLMPEFCCGQGSKERNAFRRERLSAALLLLAAAVFFSMTSRVRDNNINEDGRNENFVCSRRDAVDACPSSRIKLSEAFRMWSRANNPEDECWYNTSSSFPENFAWGEEFEFSGAYPTEDFADAETYNGIYAPCFWWGCGSCLPSQSAMQERLLRYEALAQVGAIVATALSLCLQPVYDRTIIVQAYEV